MCTRSKCYIAQTGKLFKKRIKFYYKFVEYLIEENHHVKEYLRFTFKKWILEIKSFRKIGITNYIITPVNDIT